MVPPWTPKPDYQFPLPSVSEFCGRSTNLQKTAVKRPLCMHTYTWRSGLFGSPVACFWMPCRRKLHPSHAKRPFLKDAPASSKSSKNLAKHQNACIHTPGGGQKIMFFLCFFLAILGLILPILGLILVILGLILAILRLMLGPILAMFEPSWGASWSTQTNKNQCFFKVLLSWASYWPYLALSWSSCLSSWPSWASSWPSWASS